MCCIIILQIISRQHFPLNPFGPLTAEHRHFISSYTYWSLKTFSYPGLSPTNSSLSHLLSTCAHSLFSPLPNLSEFLFLPLECPTQEWLRFPKLLMFLELHWCWEMLCFPVTMEKQYPCAVALKLRPFLRMTELPFWSWILKASPGLLFIELLDWGKQMVWY